MKNVPEYQNTIEKPLLLFEFKQSRHMGIVKDPSSLLCLEVDSRCVRFKLEDALKSQTG